VARFLRRFAVYFGLKEDDEPGSEIPSTPRSTKSLLLSGVIVGAAFALITTAFGGFDDSAGNVVVRGALFGAAMGVFWYFSDRAPHDVHDRSHDAEQTRPPTS
jgi:hypothetical protein